MHDFVVHVDRRAIGFQRKFHDIHSAHDTGAEASRSDPQQYLPILWIGIVVLKILFLEDSIIPYAEACPHPVSAE